VAGTFAAAPGGSSNFVCDDNAQCGSFKWSNSSDRNVARVVASVGDAGMLAKVVTRADRGEPLPPPHLSTEHP
jgi:hypothetical protein